MTKEAKEFLANVVGYPKEVISTIIAATSLLHVFDIVRGKTHTEFSILDNFFHFERIKLKNEDLNIYDIIAGFDSLENGLNIAQHLIESKKAISWKTYDNQKNITPKDGPVNMTFSEFIEAKTEAEMTILRDACSAWMDALMKKGNSFDAFFINGSNGLKFEQGDMVQMYDNQSNETYFGIALTGFNNAYVSVALGNKEIMPISSHSEPQKPIEMPKDIEKELRAEYKSLMESIADDKDVQFERMKKKVTRINKKEAIAQKKLEREAKAKAKEELEALQAMEFKTQKDIDEAVAKVNSLFDADDTNAHKRRAKVVKEKIADATAKIAEAKEKAKAKKPASKRQRKGETTAKTENKATATA